MIRQFSAGGVVYKKDQANILFLLRKGTSEWSLPKGWLDDLGPDQPGPFTLGTKRATSLQVEEAAVREVREETGVDALIEKRLGEAKFFFVDHHHQRIFKTVIFFLMSYKNALPEGFDFETTEIRWVTLSEAKEMLKKRKGEYDLIYKAAEILNN